MTVLRDILARFGIEVDSGPLTQLDSGIGAVVGQLQSMGQTLAAGFAVQQLTAFVDETVNAADRIADASERLGVGTEALQEFGFAAQMSGLSSEEAAAGLGMLQRTLAAAQAGAGSARGAFARMGVRLTEAGGRARSLDAVLLDVAEAVRATDDPIRRAGIAQAAFGRSGATLIPLLARGADGLAELRAEYRRLGGGASAEMIERSAELNDNLDRMDALAFSLRTRIVNLLLPSLIAGAERTLEWGSRFLEMADRSHILEAALVVLGGVAVAAGLSVSAAWAGPIAIFAAVAIAITFLILLVDDLITLFSGGTSVIGAFLDEMFGAGTAAELVAELSEAWQGLALAVGEAYDAVTQFFGLNGPEMVGDEEITRTRGIDPETGITAAEDERRRVIRSLARGEATGLSAEEMVARFGPGSTAVPRPSGGASRVEINSPVTLTVPAGTPLPEAERLRRVVGEVLDERNREAAAALATEAEAE